jgi:hypothetical protein
VIGTAGRSTAVGPAGTVSDTGSHYRSGVPRREATLSRMRGIVGTRVAGGVTTMMPDGFAGEGVAG